MHIKLKNNFLIINNYKLKCSIGKRGIKKNKCEGDGATPKASLKLGYILYRPDRVKNLKCNLKKVKITKRMGWCDDSQSKKYNRLIYFPFAYGAERLLRKDNIYDIIITTDYNSNPVLKKRGSAIFIHVAKKNFQKTKGCIALKKNDLRLLLKLVKKNSTIKII